MYETYISAAWNMLTSAAAWAGQWTAGLPITTALAAVALIGYLFGRSQVKQANSVREQDLAQAKEMIEQLQTVSQRIRQSLAMQHSSIQLFREKVQELCELEDEQVREEFTKEAERILQPAAELSSDIVHTYEEIRSQSSRLKGIQADRV